MYLPKKDIFEILSSLPCKVAQTSQTVFNELPTITFRVGDNNVKTDLNNEIVYQNIVIIIDIWSEDSTTSSTMLSEIEKLMRQNGYRLTFSADVPNNDKAIYHINSRFEM